MANLIIQTCAEAFNTTPEEVMGKRRHPNVVRARMTAMTLLFCSTSMNKRAVGRLFGGSHANTLYAIRWVQNALQVDYDYTDKIRALMEEFEVDEAVIVEAADEYEYNVR